VLAWLSLACTGPDEGPARKPDVLLVVLDTVRADRTGPYGSTNETPALDALAKRGVVYEDVTSSSWTWPSHASIFTGQPPWVHGAHFTEAEGLSLTPTLHASAMRHDLGTLAERFADAGYRTVLLSSNPLLEPGLGLSRGFEVAETFDTRDKRTFLRAEEILNEHDPRPLFLFVNFYAAHEPWEVWPDSPQHADAIQEQSWIEPWRLEGLIYPNHPGATSLAKAWMIDGLEVPPGGWALVNELYDSGVRQADRELGWLLTAWDRQGRKGAVAVTSDHGEYLGEHGLLFHCRTLYPEVTHVPLIVSAPGILPEQERVTTAMQLEHLFDGLLHLAGLAGASRLQGNEDASQPILARAWRDRGWAQLIGGRFNQGYRLYREQNEALMLADDGSAELYNLSADPTMTRDLSQDLTHRVRDLRSRAEGAYAEGPQTPAVSVDDETRERLEALGYVTPK